MHTDSSTSTIPDDVLLSVAEQLKTPFLQIARQAELDSLHGTSHPEAIRATAESAMQLIDNFLIGLQVSRATQQLTLEPVSVSAVLYDVSQQLRYLARQYGVQLELDIAGRYGTVMAHRQALLAALVSIGSTLIEGLPSQENPNLQLQLATHRCRYGIVAGLYTKSMTLHTETLDRGFKLQGKARQPFHNVSHTTGAGMYIADNILEAMHLRLKASRHHGWYGFGVVLEPNNQLQLV